MTDRVCINLSYAVPNDKAAEVENIFSTHGKWMTEFYSDGTDHIVPHSEANRHYQEIQEWAKIEGNNIIDPGA